MKLALHKTVCYNLLVTSSIADLAEFSRASRLHYLACKTSVYRGHYGNMLWAVDELPLCWHGIPRTVSTDGAGGRHPMGSSSLLFPNGYSLNIQKKD